MDRRTRAWTWGTRLTASSSLIRTAGGLTASNNRIGGITAEERNVISGNHQDGVDIAGDSGPIGNLVQGNYIGTDSTGTVAVSNGRSGVRIGSPVGSTDSASNNTIGGSIAGAGNLISANGESGVAILGASTGGTGNVVQGNFIGTDITGTKSLANPVGVSITADAFANLIGGGTPGASDVITPGVGSLFAQAMPHAGNLISSSGVGVDVRDFYTLNNRVEGNLIGTNLDGSALLGIGNGVQIAGGAGMSSAGRRMGPATSSKDRRTASVYRSPVPRRWTTASRATISAPTWTAPLPSGRAMACRSRAEHPITWSAGSLRRRVTSFPGTAALVS